MAQNNNDKSKPQQKAILENKLYKVVDKLQKVAQTTITIAGYVKDAKTGEPITGASVCIEKPKVGATTDEYGYYSLSLPKGRYVLNIQSISMNDTRRQIALYKDGKMNIELQGTVLRLKNVAISSQKLSNIKSTQMGVQKIALNIATSIQDGKPEKANMSMSVYRLDSLQGIDEMDINNYLWLSSDLVGAVKFPLTILYDLQQWKKWCMNMYVKLT